MKRLFILGLLAGLAYVSHPANAQQRVKKDMLEKSHWYTAPREYQIIDDRPVIRDFREAPGQDSGTVELPAAPGAGGGGGGAGAMAGGPGSTVPGDGLHLGGPNQGFRSNPSGLNALPKSGFGGSNIPTGGFHPKGLLPQGSTTGIHGAMHPTSSGRSNGVAASSGRSVGNYTGPSVQTYSGGYGQGSGSGSGGSSSRIETSATGHLLKRGSLLK